METAQRAVRAAAAASLRHFRRSIEVELKADHTPVTLADRESEAAILGVIRESFPDHAVLSEESGAIAGAHGLRWIVDPLDGTRGFTRGGCFWGPLVAFELEGQVLSGAMALPALGLTYWAGRGLGSYRDGQRLQLAATARWEEATLSVGELRSLTAVPRAAWTLELIRTAASVRCPGDLAGCAMLLDGRADAWIEAGVRPWDIAPLQVLVEEAGGLFTDFSGRRTIDGGAARAATVSLHGRLREQIRRQT
jgi:histidinol-phosphatase